MIFTSGSPPIAITFAAPFVSKGNPETTISFSMNERIYLGNNPHDLFNTRKIVKQQKILTKLTRY